jgi:hypothetical protein
MSLSKNRPKCSPSHILQNKYKNFTIEKSSPEILATFVIFKKLSKENNHPLGENSPNLVTLAAA